MSADREMAERHIHAANAAIAAGARAGGNVSLGDVIGGMISIFRSLPVATPDACDALAHQIMVSIVFMVGARRAKEIVDVVAKIGAGSSFS